MMRLLALAAPFFLAACSLPKEPEFHAPQESEFTVTAGEKSEMAAVGCELTDSRATCTPPTDSDAKVRKDKIDKQLAVVQKVKTEIDNRTSRTLLTAKGLINKISLEASFGVLIPSLGGKSAVADSDIKLELGYQMVVGMNCAGQVGVGSKDAPAFKGTVIYGIHGTSSEEVENIAVASVPDFAGKITASPETSAAQFVKWSSKVGQTRQSVKSDGEFKLSTYSGEKLDVNCFKIRVVKGDGTQFSDRPLADKDVRKITCSVGSLVPDKTKPNGINGGQYNLYLNVSSEDVNVADSYPDVADATSHGLRYNVQPVSDNGQLKFVIYEIATKQAVSSLIMMNSMTSLEYLYSDANLAGILVSCKAEK